MKERRFSDDLINSRRIITRSYSLCQRCLVDFSFVFWPKDSCNFPEIIGARRVRLVETAATVPSGKARGQEARFWSRDYVRHRDRVCRPCVTDAAHLDHWTHSNRPSRDTASNYAFSKVSLQLFLLFASCHRPPLFPFYMVPEKRSTTESEGGGSPDGRWKFRRNFEKFTRALDVPPIRDGRETAIKTGPKGGRTSARLVATRTTGCNPGSRKNLGKTASLEEESEEKKERISWSPGEKSWNFNRDLGKRLAKVQRAPTALLRVRATPRGRDLEFRTSRTKMLPSKKTKREREAYGETNEGQRGAEVRQEARERGTVGEKETGRDLSSRPMSRRLFWWPNPRANMAAKGSLSKG